MLVSLEDIKSYLGITDTSQDTFLTGQEAVISQSVEGYCGRKFTKANYIQTYYAEDYEPGTFLLQLFQYPVERVTSILDGTMDISTEVRLHKETGTISYKRGFLTGWRFVNPASAVDRTLIVKYAAGYDELPAPIKSVILSLIEERYNKKKNGVSLNFGSDVQSISIPGTISIAFDYSLQSNERSVRFGTLLGNYVNVLDTYRSERVITGSGKLNYVEEGS